jgi:5'-methylthioadenosine phosphorylase/5'-methylthioinosine phosphorylase
MSLYAVIGGTGLCHLEALTNVRQVSVDTPYGAPSSPLTYGQLGTQSWVFLARHGDPHHIPPHAINYRANLWALREAGVAGVIAAAASGGIRSDMAPAVLAIPDQIIDYTWGREHTLYADGTPPVEHTDFSFPYHAGLRSGLLQAGQRAGLDLVDGGVYGCTQGPRLETVAEIRRMERDGCDLVGMTGMPEASLARELGLPYASCAIVANWAAGKEDGEISMEEIMAHLKTGMARFVSLLQHFGGPA